MYSKAIGKLKLNAPLGGGENLALQWKCGRRSRIPKLDQVGCDRIRIFLRSDQSGSSLVELAFLTSLFVLLLAGSVDMGQACYVAIELSAAANAGAEYGTQNPTDISGMEKAATLNAANLNGMDTPVAFWGCECMDGTSPYASCSTIPTCSVSVVRYVAVTTAMTYKPALGFTGIPSSLALKGSARLRATY